MMMELFREFEGLKAKVIKLAEREQELEKEKSIIYKMLLQAERECTALREERDRLRKNCEVKDRIIQSARL